MNTLEQKQQQDRAAYVELAKRRNDPYSNDADRLANIQASLGLSDDDVKADFAVLDKNPKRDANELIAQRLKSRATIKSIKQRPPDVGQFIAREYCGRILKESSWTRQLTVVTASMMRAENSPKATSWAVAIR